MKATKLLVTLAVAGMLFTGCGAKNQQMVIKINDGGVTQKQFDDLYNKAIEASPFAAMGLKENEGGMLSLMTRQRVLSQLIVTELLNQEADARGIKVSKEELDEAIEGVIDKVGGKDQLLSVLKQNGVSISDFKKDIKAQVRFRKLAKEVENLEVTDKECEDYYKKNPEKFKNPEQVRASHILIMANPYEYEKEFTKGKDTNNLTEDEIKDLKAKVEAKMQERKEFADKVAKEVKADKENFAQYAQKYSDDKSSAIKGGDLGFFDRQQMVPEFSNIAFSIKPNMITNPVQSQYGYHIILVTDRREASTIPYDKAKENLKKMLESTKEVEALDRLTAAAKKKATIEFSDDMYDPDKVEEKVKKEMSDLKDKMGVPDELRNDKKDTKTKK